ncbi:8024_t:CDS:2 [Entrophospora sp. SA101]|nr:8024_t:CDS:2 [Entrophospora sp. SA101]
MIILALETSCDETSIAILENKKVLSNITISQILEQQKYGGVMPSLAAKLHIKNIQKVLSNALSKAKISPDKIDYIAYTEKPGLIICLQIGKIVAETLSLYLNKPLIPVNHLEGHIYANNYFEFTLRGETLDDAIGECLDKSAILLGYNYPGGSIIEKLALKGNNTYKLPFPKNDESLDFSFSGLKSEISRLVSKEKENINANNLARSLQAIIIGIVVGAFVLGRATVQNNSSEPKNPSNFPPNQENPPQPPNNPPHKPSSPTDPNQLQFKITYHVVLGQNHMYYTSGGDVKVILIDKENPIFLNKELTKRGNHYTITFFAKDAGKYESQFYDYYFDKNNNNFTLKPYQKQETEIKVRFVGKTPSHYTFNNSFFKGVPKDLKLFYISQNHPQIKQLLNQGKLQEDKHFIIRFGIVDEIVLEDLMYFFNKFNRELEIAEA